MQRCVVLGIKKERGFKRLALYSESLKKVLENINAVGFEVIPVDSSIGRVLFEDIYSGVDVPPFDRAAMDGFAVRSVDVTGASETNPIRLRVVGEATTSKEFTGSVGELEAVRIDTGARMPEGADAVVLLEDTDYREGYVDVYRSVSKYSNVSLRGEDIKRGQLIFRRGHFLHPVDVAVLRSLGLGSVKVFRKVKVSLASVGSELKDIGEELKPGEIIESNRIMVSGVLSKWPVEIVRSVILPDDPVSIRNFIDVSVKDSDLIVTTGGTSLGKGDIITDYIYEVGEVLFHGVALQPSKPVLFALVNGKPFIGLPGYPVAAAISTYMFVEPAILKMAGVRGLKVPSIVRGRLVRRVASKLGMLQVVRCSVRKVDNEYLVEPVYASGAGVLSSLSRADGFLIISENIEGYDAGSMVDVIIYRDVIGYGEDL